MKKGYMKQIIIDLIYGTAGLVAMNGVVQFIVTPFINRKLGQAECDTFLFFTALIGLMASSFGSGTNYARMAITTKRESKNGDYNSFLCKVAILACVVTLAALFIRQSFRIVSFILIGLLMIMTIVRYYGDVQYRLHVNYSGFFWYYILIAIGYVVGVLLFPFTQSWALILLFGEMAAVLFVTWKGDIFKPPFWERSPHYKENVKSMLSLSGAYFLSDFVSYSDRILIPFFARPGDSTTFYVATLVGKIVALLTTPLNGVIVGHLSKYKGGITKKMFLAVTGALLAVATVIVGGSMIASHILVAILYPDLYDTAKQLFLVANASQVFFFISNTMMVVVLRFAHEKYQMYLGIVYAILFFLIVVPGIAIWGLWGIAYGLLIINILKFFIITAMGFYALSGKKRTRRKNEKEI